MLTPKQVAEKIGVSVSLVYQWCKDGLLEHLRLGAKGKRGKVLIEPNAVEKFLQSCKQRPPTPMTLKHIRLE